MAQELNLDGPTEYKVLVDNFQKLKSEFIARDVDAISDLLFSLDLPTRSVYQKLLDGMQTKDEKTRLLLNCVLDKVRDNPSNFTKFKEFLKANDFKCFYSLEKERLRLSEEEKLWIGE